MVILLFVIVLKMQHETFQHRALFLQFLEIGKLLLHHQVRDDDNVPKFDAVE